MSYRIRLSPSGPFVDDSVSGAPLEVGPGSTGIVFRAMGGSTPIVINDGDEAELIRLAIEPGYHYDMHGEAVAGLYTEINLWWEYSLDGGTTWVGFPMGSIWGDQSANFTAVPVTDSESNLACCEAIDFDATGLEPPSGILWVRLYADAFIIEGSVPFTHMVATATQYVE